MLYCLLNLFLQALEAVQMVLNLTSYKRIDAELLEKIMQHLEDRASIKHSKSLTAANINNNCNQACPSDATVKSVNESSYEESTEKTSRETEHLIEFLGKILQQVCKYFRDHLFVCLFS